MLVGNESGHREPSNFLPAPSRPTSRPLPKRARRPVAATKTAGGRNTLAALLGAFLGRFRLLPVGESCTAEGVVNLRGDPRRLGALRRQGGRLQRVDGGRPYSPAAAASRASMRASSSLTLAASWGTSALGDTHPAGAEDPHHVPIEIQEAVIKSPSGSVRCAPDSLF